MFRNYLMTALRAMARHRLYSFINIVGLALGLAFAFGGFAIGGFAFGGGSLGVIAIGGAAAGYYAMGGNAYGIHPLGSNIQDQAAQKFFEGWAQNWWQWLTAAGIGLPLLYLILFAVIWIVLKREEAKRVSSTGGSKSSFS